MQTSFEELNRNELAQQFASDNYAGICPEAWAAMEQANCGHSTSYGDDPWTTRAADAFRRLFEAECEVFFVFNGTAANSLALASLCQSYHGVICCDSSHVETDECGAPEFFSNGSKLLVARSVNGKLTPEAIHELATKRQDIHYPKPRVVTITQPTETGVVYSLDELKAISAACKEHGLLLHADGARFANACARLGCAPAELSWRSGVDVLCFGGTKNGMAVGEAVLFFDRALATDFDYRCKQAGQLASKMRFLAAPWVGLLESGAWLEMRLTPIIALPILLKKSRRSRRSKWRLLLRPTASFSTRPMGFFSSCAGGGGGSIPSSAGQRGSCLHGMRESIELRRCCAIWKNALPTPESSEGRRQRVS